MNELLNIDCMEYMKDIPDNYFDLAIVDPPYGININNNMGRRKGQKHSGHKKIKWDNSPPDKEYFDELFRISKNRIIWGGNYFDLPLTGAWIFWDKLMPAEMSFSQGELAWMTFGNTIRKVVIQHSGIKNKDNRNKIHPTQKPIALYKWLLKNYAKPGWKLFDSHSGSGSFRIAAYDMGFDLISCEIDKDYCRDNEARFQNHIKQAELFSGEEIQELTYKELLNE